MSFTSKEFTLKSAEEIANNLRLRQLYESLQIEFGSNWNVNSLIGMRRQTLSRLLWINEIYSQIINIPGVICEFGVQYGSTLTQLVNLRGIYEPYNISRTIYGFDTFEGFLQPDERDLSKGSDIKSGDYSVPPDYYEILTELLELHESNNPVGHLKKFELIRGDASLTVKKFVNDNPQIVVALAIFDMDVYRPTKQALETILPCMAKGAVLVFDEFNDPIFPGETIAVKEVLGLEKLNLVSNPNNPFCAYVKLE